jgi:hypothetical protein
MGKLYSFPSKDRATQGCLHDPGGPDDQPAGHPYGTLPRMPGWGIGDAAATGDALPMDDEPTPLLPILPQDRMAHHSRKDQPKRSFIFPIRSSPPCGALPGLRAAPPCGPFPLGPDTHTVHLHRGEASALHGRVERLGGQRAGAARRVQGMVEGATSRGTHPNDGYLVAHRRCDHAYTLLQRGHVRQLPPPNTCAAAADVGMRRVCLRSRPLRLAPPSRGTTSPATRRTRSRTRSGCPHRSRARPGRGVKNKSVPFSFFLVLLVLFGWFVGCQFFRLWLWHQQYRPKTTEKP